MDVNDKKAEQRQKKYAYHNAHFKYKLIPFSTTSESELEMLDWLEKQPTMSAYVKGLIRADLDRHKEEQKKNED